MRRTTTILLAALALIGAGCGGDDGGGESSAEATRLLQRGFATDVDTGRLDLELELELEGLPQVQGPFRLELDGPFRSRGTTRIPDVDMDFVASGLGLQFDGRVTALPQNAWIEYGDETYEVGAELWRRAQRSLRSERGPDSFGAAGLDPLDWVEGAQTAGSGEIAGAPATKVTGRLDLERMLRDVNELGSAADRFPDEALDQVGEAVDPVEFEAWIGEDDIWRRIATETEFTVPEDQRDGAGGLSGGRVALELTLSDPNEPVTIESPGEGRPLSDLLRALGVPPQLLLGPGFEAPTPG